MAFTGDDQCWVPDIPITENDEWRLDIAQFGDGYAQRILDGINALQYTWDVNFQNRPKEVIIDMVNFLKAAKGNSFQFKEPVTQVMYDVWCDKWQVDWVMRRKGDSPVTPIWYGTLSAQFKRAYGVTG
jgi:phage-related protein